MPVSVSTYGIKTIHHNLFEAFVDGFEIPKITLAILNPLEVRNRDASGIGKNVWNDEDFLVKQDLVRLSRSRTVGALADNARLDAVSILVSNLVLCGSRKQDLTRLHQQVFAGNGFGIGETHDRFLFQDVSHELRDIDSKRVDDASVNVGNPNHPVA